MTLSFIAFLFKKILVISFSTDDLKQLLRSLCCLVLDIVWPPTFWYATIHTLIIKSCDCRVMIT